MQKSYWLLKTEPGTYSFSQLIRDKTTHWNGVRNFQARNFLKSMSEGDLALIYHSGDEKAVFGIARVIRSAYPDPDPRKSGDWVQVDLEAVEAMPRPIALAEIKSNPALSDLLLIRQSRLSVMPISHPHYQTLLELGKTKTVRQEQLP